VVSEGFKKKKRGFASCKGFENENVAIYITIIKLTTSKLCTHKTRTCLETFIITSLLLFSSTVPPLFVPFTPLPVLDGRYRCPELILLQDYTSAVDMWSLGCIIAELLDMLDTLNIPVSNR